jgi:membrane protease YdiL (CAAX protease family)
LGRVRWRGYLLPRLLPLGEIKATLIVAIIWAMWHLPILLIG